MKLFLSMPKKIDGPVQLKIIKFKILKADLAVIGAGFQLMLPDFQIMKMLRG